MKEEDLPKGLRVIFIFVWLTVTAWTLAALAVVSHVQADPQIFENAKLPCAYLMALGVIALLHQWIKISLERPRPSVLYRPVVFLEGARWCAMYGVDLQQGIAGFGKSPAEAMRNFDVSFNSSVAAAVGVEASRVELAASKTTAKAKPVALAE